MIQTEIKKMWPHAAFCCMNRFSSVQGDKHRTARYTVHRYSYFYKNVCSYELLHNATSVTCDIDTIWALTPHCSLIVAPSSSPPLVTVAFPPCSNGREEETMLISSLYWASRPVVRLPWTLLTPTSYYKVRYLCIMFVVKGKGHKKQWATRRRHIWRKWDGRNWLEMKNTSYLLKGRLLFTWGEDWFEEKNSQRHLSLILCIKKNIATHAVLNCMARLQIEQTQQERPFNTVSFRWKSYI